MSVVEEHFMKVHEMLMFRTCHDVMSPLLTSYIEGSRVCTVEHNTFQVTWIYSNRLGHQLPAFSCTGPLDISSTKGIPCSSPPSWGRSVELHSGSTPSCSEFHLIQSIQYTSPQTNKIHDISGVRSSFPRTAVRTSPNCPTPRLLEVVIILRFS